MALLSCDFAYALPTDPVVESGQAAVKSTAPNALSVRQTSDKAVINWRSFGIGAGESVEFAQPSSSAVVLNRVLGMDPSQLLGELKANGRVFLINPNGIVFGRNARVDVGGLVASTLSLSSHDFLANRLRFTNEGAAGAISNEGAINAGAGGIALIAPQIANQGSLRADNASIGLVSGDTVLVDVEGDGLMAFRVDRGTLAPRIEQLGRIQADGGSVSLQAKARGAMADTVLNMDGVIRARGIGEKGGRIVLDGGPAGITRVAGALDAVSSQGRGGDISVTGEKVLIDTTATVSASGDTGGAIRIGGGIRGADTTIENAEQVHIAAQASLSADGGTAGDGGSVVIWSNRSTYVGGSLSTLGKRGGFIETSSAGALDIPRAPVVGFGGTWLIDPLNIEIVSGNVATDASDASPFTPLASGAKLGVELIQDALKSGASITVTTVGTSAGGHGDIKLTADLDYKYAGDNSLTLEAEGDVILNGKISGSAAATSLNLTLQAGDHRTIQLNNSIVDLRNGRLVAASAVNLQSNVTITAHGDASLGAVDGAKSLTINSAGTTTFSAPVGSTTPLTGLTVSGAVNARSIRTNGAQHFGSIASLNGDYATGGGAFTVGGAVTLADDTTVSAGGGSINFAASVDGAHSLSTSNSASTSFVGAVGNHAALASLTSIAGAFSAASAISTSGSTNLTADTISINGLASGGGSTLTGKTTLKGDITTLHSAFSVFGPTTLGGATTIVANNGAIVFDGPVSGAETLATNSTTGTTFGATVGLGAPLDRLTVTGPIDARGIHTNGDVSLAGSATLRGSYSTAGGDFSVAGATHLTGDATVNTGVGTINFGGTVDGARSLTLTNNGITRLSGAVGSATPLSSLTIDGGGAIQLAVREINYPDIATVSTTGSQTYADPVYLEQPTFLKSNNASVLLLDSLDRNGHGFALRNGGLGGCDLIDGTFPASGGVPCLSLLGAVTLNATGALTFSDAVDGGYTLTLNGNFNKTFDALIGSTAPLASLISNGGTTQLVGAITVGDIAIDGNANLAGAYATSGGAFNVSGATALLADTSVSTGSGTINFGGTVDGARSFTLTNNGITRFSGAVGAATPLSSLTIDGGGAIQLAVREINYPDIATVSTTGSQTYADPVYLEQPTFLKSNNASVLLLDSLDRNGHGFALRNGGLGGCDLIDGTFPASGGVPCLSLLGAVTLNATGALTFSGAVDGGYTLTLNGNFNKTFHALIGSTAPLASLISNGGTTQLVGAITVGDIAIDGNANLAGAYTTSGGAFNVSGATALLADTSVTTGSGAISFGGTVNGAHALST
ncbi:beta strand repeat-containing protein, partial [Niveibacterium sp.]|uniref:beta strand repeat-containing protein n=1 Tax=Niveibacterium sp. TaxID=2017444 RepID=UPI0035B04168